MDEIIAWLLKLLEFHTTADGGDAENCVYFLQQILSPQGVKTRPFFTAGGPRAGCHLLAEAPGESADTILLHAHLDTAEYGDPSGWLFPADRPSRRRGAICGRGSIDCKGPLAVWMKLLTDAAQSASRPYTLRLLVSDLEEQGGEYGLGALLAQHPEILSGVRLVIGEGGGFPFPFQDVLYYTFQTGERESYRASVPDTLETPGWETISKTLTIGVEKGYYSEDILTYAARADALSGRRLDLRPLYDGMDDYFSIAPVSDVYPLYGKLFETALRAEIPHGRLMPCITPGYSDNRWFRRAGIPVVGFFPLDAKNSLNGIHGANEYISESSLSLAYRVMTRVLDSLKMTEPDSRSAGSAAPVPTVYQSPLR